MTTWPMLSGHTLEQFLAVPDLLGVPDPNDAFEQALIATHYRYLADRRALVVKLAVPKGYNKNTGYWFPKAKTLCDFIGWTATGRPIAFDAKRHTRDRWRYSDAKAHQWRSLKMVQAMGGLGFFLVNHQDAAYIVLANAIAPREAIALADCRVVPYTLQWDWLTVAEENWPSKWFRKWPPSALEEYIPNYDSLDQYGESEYTRFRHGERIEHPEDLPEGVWYNGEVEKL